MKKITTKFRFKRRKIENIAAYLTHLKEDENKLTEAYGSLPKVWFRGLRKLSNPHVPTFHRDGYNMEEEIYMMNLFKQNAYESLIDIPKNEWEWMFLMRHYGLPSRLLDWTENPLIGLFFSVRLRSNEQQASDDGVLWCLLPTQLNRFAIGWPEDNDSIPMFTDNEAEFSIPENETILNYLPSRINKRLFPKNRLPPPAAGICPRTNKRMQTQMSVFTIHHADTTPLEEIGDRSHIWRYRIPRENKQHIIDELRLMGITERVIFPDLDKVVADVCKSLRRS